MKNLPKIALYVVLALIGLVVALFALVWLTTYQPALVEAAPLTCPASAPQAPAGQALKVLSWNVQFMAGKNYVFWFDVPNADGPDERPSPADITLTLSEVARIIHEENPDVVLLQEVDRGAARTDNEDQLARLLALLPADYACATTAFYWKAAYVPHPRVHGSAGLSLAILSKYQIASAQRHQLELMPGLWVVQQFQLKRAVLEARLPIAGGGEFVAINTHLDAFAQGSNTMEIQAQQVDALLKRLDEAALPWIIGGDFNLLAPDKAIYDQLPPAQQYYYNPQSEVAPLFDHYQPLPTLADVTGPDRAQWFTHFPNDPEVQGPDRTIDYFFLPKTSTPLGFTIRNTDTLKISDHLPLIAVINLGP